MAQAFPVYLETLLVPTLRPGDLVILDKLGRHRGEAVRRAIREAGAKLLVRPKYSPDLHPIEQVFSKLEHLLRKAQAARFHDGLLSANAPLLAAYSSDECFNYLRSSVYGGV